MQKLWARWAALTVFVLVLGVVFVQLGQWQLRRLDERRHRNEVVTQHRDGPVLDFPQGFERPIGEDDQWRRVRAEGRFDYTRELIVRYRNQAGKHGFEVVTPLVTDHGTVLVDRGFQPQAGAGTPVAAAGPRGRVTVVGYTRRDETGPQRALTPVDHQLRLINSGVIGRAIGQDLAPGYLSLISIDPPQDGALSPLPTPSLDEGPHLSYALQWFAFTLLAGLGLFVFIRGDLRDRRRARERRTAGPSTAQPAPAAAETSPALPADTSSPLLTDRSSDATADASPRPSPTETEH